MGLAARRRDKLNELRTMAPDRIFTEEIDVTKADAPNRLRTLVEKLGGMHLFIYTSGVGYMNRDLDEAKERLTAETNAVGFITMVSSAFNYFAHTNGGHIAVISSIAGTKGLGPAPAYSATKALQNTYIDALEQAAHERHLNINFTDVRPGFVDTPLLKSDHFPMTMSAQRVARKIMQAINKDRHVVVIDQRWAFVTFLWRLLPRALWRKMKL